MSHKYHIDYKQPLDQFTKAEADYFDMETKHIAEQIAQKYTSKGPNYILAVSLHLKDLANSMRPKAKVSDEG